MGNHQRPQSSIKGHIYAIHDSKDRIVYIGETGKTIQTRWEWHCRAADRGTPGPLYTAMRFEGKSSFSIKPLKSGVISDKERKDLEAKLIHQFSTLYPNGYNMKAKSFVIRNRNPDRFFGNYTKVESENFKEQYGEDKDYFLVFRCVKQYIKKHPELESEYEDLIQVGFIGFWTRDNLKEGHSGLLYALKIYSSSISVGRTSFLKGWVNHALSAYRKQKRNNLIPITDEIFNRLARIDKKSYNLSDPLYTAIPRETMKITKLPYIEPTEEELRETSMTFPCCSGTLDEDGFPNIEPTLPLDTYEEVMKDPEDPDQQYLDNPRKRGKICKEI